MYVFLFVITGVIDLAACYFFYANKFPPYCAPLHSIFKYFASCVFVVFFLFVCLFALLTFIAYSSRKVISYKYVLTYLTYSFTGEN